MVGQSNWSRAGWLRGRKESSPRLEEEMELTCFRGDSSGLYWQERELLLGIIELRRKGELEIGGTMEDCISREFLLLKGVGGGRKDFLVLPTGRLGPEEDLTGITSGWVGWTMRDIGDDAVHGKREQGGGDTITNCCAWNKHGIVKSKYPSLSTLARVSMPWCA